MAKVVSDTYLFGQYNKYEQDIFNFVMSGTVVDKNTPAFQNIIYDVKRRNISNYLTKLIMSDKVVLMCGEKPLPKAFKVICIKDIKGKNKNEKKIFIDCSDIIGINTSGDLVCTNIEILISYLVCATVHYIYYVDETRLINNAKLTEVGTSAFCSLMTYIVDYVSKISSISNSRAKCVYLCGLYYLSNILGKDINNASIRNVAIKQCGLSNRECQVIDIQLDDESFLNIKYFVNTLSNILKVNKLTLDVIIEKWMYIFGEGTIFSVEFFPSFAAMLTDTYVGGYINNQKTIEKVVGKDMVEFSKLILEIGADAI